MISSATKGPTLGFHLFPNPLPTGDGSTTLELWALVVARPDAVVALSHFPSSVEAETSLHQAFSGARPEPEAPLLRSVRRQLQEYLNRARFDFDLPLAPQGTTFQQRVWEELRKIPYGQTRSYLEVALALGSAGSTRAVGQANHRNPIGIVIPCHRVIAQDGSLGGYAGGAEMKRCLLRLEGVRWGDDDQRRLF